MRGPEILARTMSVATTRGSSDRPWQYHSRSDNHSKVACWTVLFDLMLECDVFREHVAAGRIGFGINFVMVGPINKTLDLVVTRIPATRKATPRISFTDLVEQYGIKLDTDDRAMLDQLPAMAGESRKHDVSEVAIALEAKACMTEHSKSLPRLHAEILATGYLARRAQPHCITASYSMVNASTTFVTPSGKGKVNKHTQPEDARRVVEMLGKAIPLKADSADVGYDVVGAIVVNCRNDGSPVTVLDAAPAPVKQKDHLHYERMISSLCGQYRARFGR
jgi:hypothetical protein